MFKKLIKTGIASVALAASAFFIAAPASADAGPNWKVERGHHFGGKHGRFRINDWGQTRFQVRRMKRNAIDACAYQLKADAHAYGYKRARIVDFKAKQVGKRRFRVYTKAKLFDGYKVRYDTYDCVVRRGYVAKAGDLRPIKFHRGRGHNGFRKRAHF